MIKKSVKQENKKKKIVWVGAVGLGWVGLDGQCVWSNKRVFGLIRGWGGVWFGEGEREERREERGEKVGLTFS